MSITPLQQPDFTSDTGTEYKTAIDNAIAVLIRMAGAFAVQAQDTPDMTVKVNAGSLVIGGTLTEIAEQNTGSPDIAAPSSDDRIDRIVLDGSGNVKVITGTEGSPVSAPSVPLGDLPLARIALAPSTTAITNSLITDERTVDQLRGISVDGDGNIFNYGQKVESKTSSFTLSASEAGKNLDCELNPSPESQSPEVTIDVTVPADATDDLPVGTTVTFVQTGTAPVVVVPEDPSPGGGPTVNSIGGNLRTSEQWAAMTLYKRAADDWVLIGNLG